jgi:hypothetical protein
MELKLLRWNNMVEYIKTHYNENKIIWWIMIVSGIILVLLFADNLFSLLKAVLSWTFAVASYKIFVEDLTIARLKDRKIEPMNTLNKKMNGIADETIEDFKRLWGNGKK